MVIKCSIGVVQFSAFRFSTFVLIIRLPLRYEYPLFYLWHFPQCPRHHGSHRRNDYRIALLRFILLISYAFDLANFMIILRLRKYDIYHF